MVIYQGTFTVGEPIPAALKALIAERVGANDDEALDIWRHFGVSVSRYGKHYKVAQEVLEVRSTSRLLLVQVPPAARLRMLAVQEFTTPARPIMYEYPHHTRGWAGDSRRCGAPAMRLGLASQCDMDSADHCCSKAGECGGTEAHCKCEGCEDMRRAGVNADVDASMGRPRA